MRVVTILCLLLAPLLLIAAMFLAGAGAVCDQTTCGDRAAAHAWELGLAISAAVVGGIGVWLVWWMRHRG